MTEYTHQAILRKLLLIIMVPTLFVLFFSPGFFIETDFFNEMNKPRIVCDVGYPITFVPCVKCFSFCLVFWSGIAGIILVLYGTGRIIYKFVKLVRGAIQEDICTELEV